MNQSTYPKFRSKEENTKLYRNIHIAVWRWNREIGANVSIEDRTKLVSLINEYCIKHYQEVLNDMSRIVRRIGE